MRPVPEKSRCQARTKSGRRCRKWAVLGSEPPRCAIHSPTKDLMPDPRRKGRDRFFYRRTYTVEELADMVKEAMDHSLDDELMAARVAVRRVLVRIKKEMPEAEFARLVGLVFKGIETIVRVLRAQRDFSSSSEEVTRVIGQVLDTMADEAGIDL